MGVRLPAEYQEVEYLDSTSTLSPYIDTGIPITEDLKFEIEFMLINTNLRLYFMGAYRGTDFYLYTGGTGYFQTAFGALYANTNLAVDTRRHRFVYQINDGILTVKDSDTVILAKRIGVLSANSILIAGTATGGRAACKTFESKMTKAGVVIQDLIPCYRITDSKPGMYDLISGEFFTNAGTGEFLVGPDVIGSISPLMVAWRRAMMAQVQGGSPGVLPDAYQQVAYLLSFAGSSGHYSYINTGIKPAVDVSIRGVFSFENGIYTNLFGARTGNSTPQWFVSMPANTTPATIGFWYNNTRSMKKLSHNNEGDWFTISMSNTNGTVVDDDGVTLFSATFNAIDFPDVEMFLFARSNGGSPASTGIVGCKRFTIYKAGSKIQDLIPCYHKADDKPGMYDIITDTFFVSAGDREFTVGPDIN